MVLASARAILTALMFAKHRDKNMPLVAKVASIDAIKKSNALADQPRNSKEFKQFYGSKVYSFGRVYTGGDAVQAARAAGSAAYVSRGGADKAPGHTRAAASYATDATDAVAAVNVAQDENIDFAELIVRPLWHTGKLPETIKASLEKGKDRLKGNQDWDFWRRWYHGLLVGQPLDWELQRRVALIENDIWEAGPEAVADEISRIEAELAAEPLAQDTRFPEFEPTFVDVLFRNRVVAGTQTLQLAQQIEDSIARFHAETGLNQLPEAFQPLERMPRTLTRIGAVLTHEAQTPETEQRLREEIGRLSARVAELEKELAAAQKSGEPIFAPAFKEQAGKSLGDWKLYATLCAGLWVVSGDSVEMQTRLENLLGLREALFGDVCPSPKVAPFAAPSHAIKT